jgi:hypothetical protein
MKLTRTLTRGRFVCALMLTLTLAFSGASAQADMLEGSIAVSAYWADINGPDLASSTLFTPFAPDEGTLYEAGGTNDFANLIFVPMNRADPLNLNDPLAWTFNGSEGSWTTDTFVNIDPGTAANGYLDFYLTGIFTPDLGGSLAGFEPTKAEMRISLNHSGSTTSWAGTMNMTGPPIPEPMTMSLLGLGGLTMLFRRRR